MMLNKLNILLKIVFQTTTIDKKVKNIVCMQLENVIVL